jgi:hypothetical protein
LQETNHWMVATFRAQLQRLLLALPGLSSIDHPGQVYCLTHVLV